MEKRTRDNKRKINKLVVIMIIIIAIFISIGIGIGAAVIKIQLNSNTENSTIEKSITQDNTTENSTTKNRTIRDIIVDSDKPIIYLYPEQEEEIRVKLGKKEKLLYTYPKYKEEWKVLAKPNGELKDLETGRDLYCLYWEGKNTVVKSELEEGFVVKGEDTIEFLEEKLEILGLTQREANEFIIYWLPKMESNPYNYIRFETEEEINENMPLEINPSPDTLIRVLMEFKGIEEKIEVKEQKLETPERKGFVVVEWGGTEIK